MPPSRARGRRTKKVTYQELDPQCLPGHPDPGPIRSIQRLSPPQLDSLLSLIAQRTGLSLSDSSNFLKIYPTLATFYRYLQPYKLLYRDSKIAKSKSKSKFASTSKSHSQTRAKGKGEEMNDADWLFHIWTKGKKFVGLIDDMIIDLEMEKTKWKRREMECLLRCVLEERTGVRKERVDQLVKVAWIFGPRRILRRCGVVKWMDVADDITG